jgi:hypothetical protein
MLRSPVFHAARDAWGQHQETKVFLLLFSKKEDSSFSEEKEAKRLLFSGAAETAWLFLGEGNCRSSAVDVAHVEQTRPRPATI